MTIAQALSSDDLVSRNERELLLAFAMEKERTWLLTHESESLTTEQEKSYAAFIKRRAGGEPLAYITGTKEFYGRSFHVDRSVLIPRPATEALIDLTLETLKTGSGNEHEADSGIIVLSHIFRKWGKENEPHTLIDVGTGSGCIAITLARELVDDTVIATDVSPQALMLAKKNAEEHQVHRRIKFHRGSLLADADTKGESFFVVSNPPYIPDGAPVSPETEHFEPHLALFAGSDGTDIITELIAQCKTHQLCRGIALECRVDQREKILSLLG